MAAGSEKPSEKQRGKQEEERKARGSEKASAAAALNNQTACWASLIKSEGNCTNASVPFDLYVTIINAIKPPAAIT